MINHPINRLVAAQRAHSHRFTLLELEMLVQFTVYPHVTWRGFWSRVDGRELLSPQKSIGKLVGQGLVEVLHPEDYPTTQFTSCLVDDDIKDRYYQLTDKGLRLMLRMLDLQDEETTAVGVSV